MLHRSKKYCSLPCLALGMQYFKCHLHKLRIACLGACFNYTKCAQSSYKLSPVQKWDLSTPCIVKCLIEIRIYYCLYSRVCSFKSLTQCDFTVWNNSHTGTVFKLIQKLVYHLAILYLTKDKSKCSKQSIHPLVFVDEVTLNMPKMCLNCQLYRSLSSNKLHKLPFPASSMAYKSKHSNFLLFDNFQFVLKHINFGGLI